MKIAEKKQLYNIVVIDDEENNLKSVELALRGQPYSLYLFNDPKQAMEKIPSLRADIILLDILMPDHEQTEKFGIQYSDNIEVYIPHNPAQMIKKVKKIALEYSNP